MFVECLVESQWPYTRALPLILCGFPALVLVNHGRRRRGVSPVR